MSNNVVLLPIILFLCFIFSIRLKLSINLMQCFTDCQMFIYPNSLSQIIQVAFSIAVFITYGLQAYVAMEILWGSWLSNLFKKRRNQLIAEFSIRFGIVLLTCKLALFLSIFIIFFYHVFSVTFTVTLAYLIPHLGLFISLFGAFCLSMLAVSFPALIEIFVLYPNSYGRCHYVLIRNVLIIIIGVIAFITGTSISINAIISTFNPNQNSTETVNSTCSKFS